MTFSATLMSSNVTGTWKVRAMPSRACASGVALVTSWPLNRMVPAVGCRSPARQLKNVLLPAPFGPIRPTMSPSVTLRSAPSTARKPPKLMTMPLASSSMSGPPCRDVAPDLRHAAGAEAGDQHDDGTVDDEGDAGAAAAEHGVGGFLQ